MAIDYLDNPSELRRTDDGSPITLNGNPTEIRFSEDIETSRILVTYDDGFAELLRMADLALVRRFDSEFGRVSFVPGFGGRLHENIILYALSFAHCVSSSHPIQGYSCPWYSP